jgi:hypothetical protein
MEGEGGRGTIGRFDGPFDPEGTAAEERVVGYFGCLNNLALDST